MFPHDEVFAAVRNPYLPFVHFARLDPFTTSIAEILLASFLSRFPKYVHETISYEVAPGGAINLPG